MVQASRADEPNCNASMQAAPHTIYHTPKCMHHLSSMGWGPLAGVRGRIARFYSMLDQHYDGHYASGHNSAWSTGQHLLHCVSHFEMQPRWNSCAAGQGTLTISSPSSKGMRHTPQESYFHLSRDITSSDAVASSVAVFFGRSSSNLSSIS